MVQTEWSATQPVRTYMPGDLCIVRHQNGGLGMAMVFSAASDLGASGAIRIVWMYRFVLDDDGVSRPPRRYHQATGKLYWMNDKGWRVDGMFPGVDMCCEVAWSLSPLAISRTIDSWECDERPWDFIVSTYLRDVSHMLFGGHTPKDPGSAA